MRSVCEEDFLQRTARARKNNQNNRWIDFYCHCINTTEFYGNLLPVQQGHDYKRQNINNNLKNSNI